MRRVVRTTARGQQTYPRVRRSADMTDEEGPLQRARTELKRAAESTTSDVKRQVADIDDRLEAIDSDDGAGDEATQDARLEAIAENLAVLREKTDGQTYTKIKHAEEFIQEYRDER